MTYSNADKEVLAASVRLLNRGHFVGPVNLINAIILAAILLAMDYPMTWLLAWVAAMAVAVAARMEVRRRFLAAADASSHAAGWARLTLAGAAATGLVWGVLLGAVAGFGPREDLLLVALVAAGMAAGSLTSMSPHLPTLLAYVVPLTMPLVLAVAVHPEPAIQGVGLMMLIFVLVIIAVGRNMNRTITQSIVLDLRNTALSADLQAAQARLETAEAEKWKIVAHLSQELRAPLTAVLGFAESMHRERHGRLGDPRYAEYAGHIRMACRNIITLANEILSYARGEAGLLILSESLVDVPAVVRGCAAVSKPAAAERRVRIAVEADESLPRLWVDETKVQQILNNLVANAIAATGPDGTVTISASVDRASCIELSVADTGIGMTAADAERALLPFVRLDQGMQRQGDGIGLGLTLCKRFAELHGATLAIDSRPGAGTRVTIRFPVERVVGRGSD